MSSSSTLFCLRLYLCESCCKVCSFSLISTILSLRPSHLSSAFFISHQSTAGGQMARPPEHDDKQPSIARTIGFFKTLGLFQNIPEASERKDFYSDIIRSLLKVVHVDRGRVVCTLKVLAAVVNPHNTLHGGVVASVAEIVGLACAKSAAGDKEFFLGEFSTAYLTAASLDTEVEIEGRILRQGRSVIVTNIEFRIKESKKLAYTSRATHYIMPAASL